MAPARARGELTVLAPAPGRAAASEARVVELLAAGGFSRAAAAVVRLEAVAPSLLRLDPARVDVVEGGAGGVAGGGALVDGWVLHALEAEPFAGAGKRARAATPGADGALLIDLARWGGARVRLEVALPAPPAQAPQAPDAPMADACEERVRVTCRGVAAWLVRRAGGAHAVETDAGAVTSCSAFVAACGGAKGAWRRVLLRADTGEPVGVAPPTTRI